MNTLFTKPLAVIALLPGIAFAQKTTTSSFNPDISLSINGRYATYSEAESAPIAGIWAAPESERPPEGFSLGESELILESNVDHLWRGRATVALEEEDGETHAVLEEAFLDSLSLPAGLSLRFGRFLSGIGYLNAHHPHAWDFADAPLPYEALLGGNYRDDGIQLRTLLPAPLMIEIGAELLRGDNFPGGGENASGAKAWSGFVHIGGDLGDSSAWSAGLSQLRAEADDRRSGEEDELGFNGQSRVSIFDAVYKWAPNGNSRDRSLIIQGEYVHRRESGSVTDESGGSASLYAGDQDSWYLQTVYGFKRSWRLGLRYDELRTDNTLSQIDTEAFALLANGEGRTARRTSVMLDYSPSEFSRLRLQCNWDDTRSDDEIDRQCLVQYIANIGAHSAHSF